MTLPKSAFPFSLHFVSAMLLTGLMLLSTVHAEATPRHPGATAAVAILNDAWNFENNELIRSLAFAQKADQEGYAPAASLFRASAAAERVHVRNLAVAMKKLGFEPDAVPDPLVVNSTAENLRVEIAAHASYRDKILPALVVRARHEGFVGVTRTLSDASRTEHSLVNYYTAASAHLDSSRGRSAETYYVCSTCGYITTNADFQVCRVCYHSREKHQAVS